MAKKYDIKVYHKDNSKSQNTLFPIPLRCGIIGSSGSGKTTLLENFIYNHWINYDYLYVCSKSLDQNVYRNMQTIFENINIELGEEISFFFDDIEQMPKVDECNENSLVIFDDCILENQDIIKEYFVRGRHKNISCFYLNQCYSRLDRQFIRNNLNFVCIFNQSEHYIDMICSDFCASDFETNKNLKKFVMIVGNMNMVL